MADLEQRALAAERRLEELTAKVAQLESIIEGSKAAKNDNVAKQEPPKKEVPKKQEAPKKEPAKKEPAKKEPAKKEPAKKEPAKKQEATDQASAHKETTKQEKKEPPVIVPDKAEFPRVSFNKLMTQRFFIAPSFEIYGGVAGLFDLGPPACAIKANILNLWRQHFVLQENMLEVDCTSVTPYPVLKTSGHVAKFADLMVKDVKTGNCFRADHLLEHHLETFLADKKLDPALRKEYELVIAQADSYDAATMGEILKKYNTKAPDTGNDLTDPEPFNLMFSTAIGPTGQNPGFLRPETAQGIFVNFKRLLEYNGGKLPFAGAQIGQAFRNEIAPRSGLLRVREFTLAEIEHFVNPEDKSHTKFSQVKDLVLTLFPRQDQVTTLKTIQMTLGEAVAKKIIANETLAYFLGRTHLFLVACGIQPERLRFRQHLQNEMAHYACDCWDAEIQSSYGWVECVGHADRAAFDLSQHSQATKQNLQAFVDFPEGPREIEVNQIFLEKSIIGKKFNKDSQKVIEYLNVLDAESVTELALALKEKGQATITVGAGNYEITSDMVSFKSTKKKVSGKNIIPGVIEPSFGIGRILYSVLEHSYRIRENDEQRGYLQLPPAIAPVKVSVLPLISRAELLEYVPKVSALLTFHNISSKIDDTGQSIGKRYARTDEIGIPFGLTIDFDTLQDKTLTLRERDSTRQVRVKFDEVPAVLKDLIEYRTTWAEVEAKYPKVESKE